MRRALSRPIPGRFLPTRVSRMVRRARVQSQPLAARPVHQAAVEDEQVSPVGLVDLSDRGHLDRRAARVPSQPAHVLELPRRALRPQLAAALRVDRRLLAAGGGVYGRRLLLDGSLPPRDRATLLALLAAALLHPLRRHHRLPVGARRDHLRPHLRAAGAAVEDRAIFKVGPVVPPALRRGPRPAGRDRRRLVARDLAACSARDAPAAAARAPHGGIRRRAASGGGESQRRARRDQRGGRGWRQARVSLG